MAVLEKAVEAPAGVKHGDLAMADGVRIHWMEAGEGVPVVLLHGYTSCCDASWFANGVARELAKDHRVIGIDARGHGRSDKPHDPAFYAREAMAGDILALMDHLDIRRADLLGYSMGAHLALGAALAHPVRFGHLILGGVGKRTLGGAALASPSKMTMAEAMRAADVETIDEPTLKGFRRFAEAQGEDLLALAACSEGRGRPLPADDLAGLSVPTLVIAGALDEIAGDPQPLADAIPGAKCVAVPGCDHFSVIPHALFKASVFDFLDGWLEEM